MPASTDLKKANSEFQQKHSQSPPHLQSAFNVRQFLDPSSKSQNESELKNTLSLPSVTIEQAIAGLALLDEWKSEESTKKDYLQAAAKKWPDATVFQTI